MAEAVAASGRGHDYQARLFWHQACRLYLEYSSVVRVGYEVGHPKAFDDVAVFYEPPFQDWRDGAIDIDYYQSKFHVDYRETITCHALTEPRFIGATRYSFLQRLRDAVRLTRRQGQRCRFYLVSPWMIDKDDPLGQLVGTNDGELRLPVLANGGPRSEMGRVRESWRTHLELPSDSDLLSILQPLRIHAGAPALASLANDLNYKLQLAGLVPLPDQRHINPYDAFIRTYSANGRRVFDRDTLREACEMEGLWMGTPPNDPQVREIGVRSFLLWTEYLEDKTDALLDLTPFFDQREIKAPSLWREEILPQLNGFLRQHLRQAVRYHLHLDVHASIAFAAGYLLSKAGADVVPVQRTPSGRVLWDPAETSPAGDLPTWELLAQERPAATGHDVALAISLTHDVAPDVTEYVDVALPGVGRVLTCTLAGGPSSTSVRGAAHGRLLSEQLSHFLKTQRTAAERRAALHLFVAAPNAFTFFLGRLAPSFGRCVLYEYDFDNSVPGAYEPALSFPPAHRAHATSSEGASAS